MPQWLSFHIRPHETPDAFLARGVRPFLEKHIWHTQGARAFFVRQEDADGSVIRLRLHGPADWMETTLRPAAFEWFSERGTVEESPYQPEPERFGGPAALQLAEEHFHLSTRVVLDRLNRPYTHGDSLFDALRLDLILVSAAGFIRTQASRYFAQLCDQWLPVFFQPLDDEKPAGHVFSETVKASFEQSLDLQREDLKAALEALLNALAEKKFDDEQPEWKRWFRGNELILKELGDDFAAMN